MYEIFNDTLNF